jgi:hypothetical protein
MAPDEIMKKAKRDRRVLPLLDELEGLFRVELSKTTTCRFDLDRNVIACADSERPGADLAHELLHLKMKLRGCRPVCCLVRKDNPQIDLTLINCLNNELQHHRMYDEFISCGFWPDEFYGNEEPKSPLDTGVKQIDEVIEYFSLIAPGGSRNPEKRTDEENEFLKSRSEHPDALLKIRGAVKDWADSQSYDIEPTIRRIWEATECGPAWFGYSKREGFFAGGKFDISEEKYALYLF